MLCNVIIASVTAGEQMKRCKISKNLYDGPSMKIFVCGLIERKYFSVRYVLFGGLGAV